jgi:hypothetical protein
VQTLETQRAASISSHANSGRFNQRLNHPVFGTSSSSPIWPHHKETDAEAYQISDTNSFAFRLYVDTLALVVQSMRGDVDIPGFIPSILRYRFRYEKANKLMELISSQLQNMKINENNTDAFFQIAEPPIDSTGRRVMSEKDYRILGLEPLILQIARDAKKDAICVTSWLDPWHTQKYLTEKWGMALSATSVSIPQQTLRSVSEQPNTPIVIPPAANRSTAAVAVDESSAAMPTMHAVDTSRSQLLPIYLQEMFQRKQNPSSNQSTFFGLNNAQKPRHITKWLSGLGNSEDLVFSSQSLVQKLCIRGICFAEGPRFHKDHINEAVLEVLEGVTASRNLGDIR